MKLFYRNIGKAKFNGYSRISFLFIPPLLIITLCSCCPDDITYRAPRDAVRYYNDHDSITLYCPENDSFMIFQFCERTAGNWVDISENRCGTKTNANFVTYRLHTDSCQSENSFRVNVYPELNNNNNVTANIRFFGYDDLMKASFTGSPKSTVEIRGHTYENTIKIFSVSGGDTEFAIFSYEYGIIQVKFENQTFSLVNDEI